MTMVEKNKNLFVITLGNGKQTYFDFVDNTIHGVSGKIVKTFNSEAKKILKAEKRNNFLANYFVERNATWSPLLGVNVWSPSMVETIYSLFAEQYPCCVLETIAEFCYSNNYTLNKKGIKVLKEALHSLEDENGKIGYVSRGTLHNTINTILYNEYPQIIINLTARANDKTKKIIIADAKKIAFHYEHENWDLIETSYCRANSIFYFVEKYIELCELLHKDRTYKNLLLSICLMEKEKELMSEQLCADYQKNAPLFFEDDNFTVLVPTTAEEFKAEADYQQNCVFRLYYPKVKNLETHVVFIRKKEDVNTPYITCEVDNNGRIVQYLTRFNKNVSDEHAKDFQRDYQEFLYKNF